MNTNDARTAVRGVVDGIVDSDEFASAVLAMQDTDEVTVTVTLGGVPFQATASWPSIGRS
jgi:hypothetical protein